MAENSDKPQDNLGQQTTDQYGEKLQQLDQNFQSVVEKLEALNRNTETFQQEVVNRLQQQSAQSAAASVPDDDYDIYDGKKFAERIKGETQQVTQKMIQETLQKQQALNTKILEMASDYPDVTKAGTDLQKAFVNAHNSLNKSLQETPEGYELALARAVKQTKAKPVSETPQQEDFALGSSGSGQQAKSKKPDPKQAERVKMISQLLGRDIESEEYNKRIQGALERKNWKRYE